MDIDIARQKEFMPKENQPNDWMEYWFVFIAYGWVILAVTIVFMIGSVVYYFRLPNLYTATTMILAEETDSAPKTHEGMLMPAYSHEEEYYGTQIAILTGRKTEEAVLSELGGITDYRIDARRVRDARILSLSVTHPDPIMAAKIANKFAEVYVRESKRENAFMGQQMLKFLPGSSEANGTANSSELPQGFNKQEFASSLTSVSGDAQIQQLSTEKLQIQSKLTELSQRYRSEHPMIKELNQRLSAIDNDIKKRTETILSNVKASLTGDVNVTNIKVLEEAQVPSSPSEPNRLKGIFVCTLGGFLIATFLVFLLEYSNQRIRTENDAMALGVCFLGYIPLAREFLKNKKNHFHDEPDLMAVLKSNQLLADAVASVRTHILFSMPYEKSRRIMLTSTVPGEGKSTCAALLAISLTTLGRKILLIDADLRKPTLHRYLGFRNEKGLTDYLIGNATFEEIVHPMQNGLLQVITAGSASPNPSELLASERLRELLNRCEESFDRIVIDVPPVLYIPDGLVLAKIVHTGVLVCGAGMVHRKTIQQVIEKFHSINYSFIGAIINRTDFNREGYRYKYYKTYKDYYSPRKH